MLLLNLMGQTPAQHADLVFRQKERWGGAQARAALGQGGRQEAKGGCRWCGAVGAWFSSDCLPVKGGQRWSRVVSAGPSLAVTLALLMNVYCAGRTLLPCRLLRAGLWCAGGCRQGAGLVGR